jgi:cysteinyl-tRNA synthetase
MKLYNTPTKQVEEIKPQNAPEVTVYTCGPTVYDYAHIGHWFTYVRMDTLIRTLKAAGLKPKWVMNITDVGHLVSDADEGEDKLEKGAQREGKTAWEVAEFYTKDFLEGMKTLNMLQPDVMPKATDHIPEQIELIKKLDEKGYTYVIDDGVYYDTSKFPRYGDFAGLDLKEQQAGARVAVNPQKRSQSDFALWKFSPKDHQRDMEWDSPWGKGFPGWHIECSAMSMKYLGETLDLHTGGIDHIPVHHTNEIAQSEAATGKTYSNYWLHANHVLVDGQKISKSLGNGIRLQEIIDKGIPPEAVRLYVLESHYRTQAHFTWEGLQAARNRLKSLQALADRRFQPIGSADEDRPEYGSVVNNVRDALLYDLRTPQALESLAQFESEIAEHGIAKQEQPEFVGALQFIDEVLGLNLLASEDISEQQKQLIADRENARKAQDWTKSDELRNQLQSQGIGLNDTPEGAIWFRS